MITNFEKPEILSPAGDMDCLKSALNFGADAVFLAGKMFGMRSAPQNFDNDQLKKACDLAHAKGARIHVTCNTLPRNNEIPHLQEFMENAQACGVDAFIIADLGVFEAAKKYMTGRDANHGDCAQPCRWKYHLYEENRQGQYFPVEETGDGTYLYNSRDLCMIEHIPELVKAGISSFKIEGRAKSAYYVAVTTNAYRHAVDDYFAEGDDYVLKPWIREELEKISHREYNTGFYFGREPGQVTGNGGYIRHYDNVALCEELVDDTTAVITQRNKFYVGDTLDVLPPSGVPFEIKCESLTTDEGMPVDSAPHPMQRLTMKCNAPVPSGSVIRKKRD